MTPRTVKADDAVRRGRMTKAEQFAAAAVAVDMLADEAADIADAYATLCVHAGIAAADVICAARLGEYSRGRTTARRSRCSLRSTSPRRRTCAHC